MIHSIKHLLFIFIILFLSRSYLSAQPLLEFITMVDFPPYSYLENGKPTGIDVDIINEMAQRGRLKIKIKFVPWKRVMHYTKYGIVDGAFAAFKSPEREMIADYVQTPLHKSTYKLFVKKDKGIQYNSIQDLYGKRIGKNLGFHIGGEFEHAAKDGKIIILEAAMERNFKRLIHDRIDGVVGNSNEVWMVIKKMNVSDEIVALPKSVRKPRGAYLMIPKSSKTENKEKLVQKISNTLKSMEEDGTIDRINSIYLQKNR